MQLIYNKNNVFSFLSFGDKAFESCFKLTSELSSRKKSGKVYEINLKA